MASQLTDPTCALTLVLQMDDGVPARTASRPRCTMLKEGEGYRGLSTPSFTPQKKRSRHTIPDHKGTCPAS
jgi:hypothetical protein